MKVRLMGGPCMGKVIQLSESSARSQRYYVTWSDPPTSQWSRFDVMPTTDITYKQGHYKPSKKPGVWTFDGDYKADPIKSFERRYQTWRRKVSKLAAQGVPSDHWPPRPSR